MEAIMQAATISSIIAAAGILLASCTDVAQAPIQAEARPVPAVGGAKTIVRRPGPEELAALAPAAGGSPAEAERPMVNVHLVNAGAGRALCVMEVYDFVCDRTHTWNLCGGEEEIIAICADERGLGHAQVRVANFVNEDYSWAEYSDVKEGDVLKR
jgi:hypothetical protein